MTRTVDLVLNLDLGAGVAVVVVVAETEGRLPRPCECLHTTSSYGTYVI